MSGPVANPHIRLAINKHMYKYLDPALRPCTVLGRDMDPVYPFHLTPWITDCRLMPIGTSPNRRMVARCDFKAAVEGEMFVARVYQWTVNHWWLEEREIAANVPQAQFTEIVPNHYYLFQAAAADVGIWKPLAFNIDLSATNYTIGLYSVVPDDWTTSGELPDPPLDYSGTRDPDWRPDDPLSENRGHIQYLKVTVLLENEASPILF